MGAVLIQIRKKIGIRAVCQCLHITILPIKSERKSESETKNGTVSGNKPLDVTTQPERHG